MIETSTKETRGYFLLQFTKQLIKSNKNINIYLLDEILKQRLPHQRKQVYMTKETIQEKLEQRKKPLENPKETSILIQDLRNIPLSKKNTLPILNNQKKKLTMPASRIPENLIPRPNKDLDQVNFGKLQMLLNDSNVREIEVEAPNQKTIVNGIMGRKNTNIILTQSEIETLTNNLSLFSKIPISEGITKIAISNLTITIIKSEKDIHFIIRKNSQTPVPKPFYT